MVSAAPRRFRVGNQTTLHACAVPTRTLRGTMRATSLAGRGPFSRRHQPTDAWLGFVKKSSQAYAGLRGEGYGHFVIGRMSPNRPLSTLHDEPGLVIPAVRCTGRRDLQAVDTLGAGLDSSAKLWTWSWATLSVSVPQKPPGHGSGMLDEQLPRTIPCPLPLAPRGWAPCRRPSFR